MRPTALFSTHWMKFSKNKCACVRTWKSDVNQKCIFANSHLKDYPNRTIIITVPKKSLTRRMMIQLRMPLYPVKLLLELSNESCTLWQLKRTEFFSVDPCLIKNWFINWELLHVNVYSSHCQHTRAEIRLVHCQDGEYYRQRPDRLLQPRKRNKLRRTSFSWLQRFIHSDEARENSLCRENRELSL